MTVFSGSRYVTTPPTKVGNTIMLKLRERHKFDISKASLYTVIQGDTIDGIAYKLYGNASLWWAIMDANPKYQNELDMKAGDVINIPALDEVLGL